MNRPAVRLAILATLLLAVCLSCAGAALATSPPATPAPPSGTIVEVGHDATVAPEDVADDAVAVGGDVIVAGTLRGSAVAVGGDVVLLPTALVLGNAVSIGGHVDRQPGSAVHGNVVSTRFGFVGSAASALLGEPVWHPFRAGTLLGWVASTILYVLVAVLCALLVPRQVMAVRDRVVAPPLDIGRLGSSHGRGARAHLQRAAAGHRGRHPGPHPLAAHRGAAGAVLRLRQHGRRRSAAAWWASPERTANVSWRRRPSAWYCCTCCV